MHAAEHAADQRWRTESFTQDLLGVAAWFVVCMQGGCKHCHRWVQPRGGAQAGTHAIADEDLLVDIPVDLAWSGLACMARPLLALALQAPDHCSAPLKLWPPTATS